MKKEGKSCDQYVRIVITYIFIQIVTCAAALQCKHQKFMLTVIFLRLAHKFSCLCEFEFLVG